MSRTIFNFWLDVTLLVSFLAAVLVAGVLRFAFPPATSAGGWLLWGWDYDGWFELLFWMISIFAVTVIVHVMMHWTWICGVIASRLLRSADGRKRQLSDGAKTLYGVALLAIILHLLGAFVFFAMLSAQGPA